jgi:hypothetical protein
MAFEECGNCSHSDKPKQSRKRYILPLFFLFSGLLALVYERDLDSPNIIMTILGSLSATAGFVWLVVTGLRSGKN